MPVPIAKAVVVHRCANPECPNVHIDLVDEHDEPIARGAIHYADMPGLMESLKDITFEIVSQLD